MESGSVHDTVGLKNQFGNLENVTLDTVRAAESYLDLDEKVSTPTGQIQAFGAIQIKWEMEVKESVLCFLLWIWLALWGSDSDIARFNNL